mmetsp:Transcript_24305/g.29408  ORF Transcript_24305/g.29408 Transcript_24305/m.29408 type:complete len:109 (-) Transcript_24305:26-352(-)
MGNSTAVWGIHLHVFAEPVIAEGGIAFGGPITLRVVENKGQCPEFERVHKSNGGRCERGPIFLHPRDVTSQKQQTAASGAIEGGVGSPFSFMGPLHWMRCGTYLMFVK